MTKDAKSENKTTRVIDNSWKQHIGQRICYGIMMGVSDGIPGYSGGTTLSLIDFYEEFIDKTKRIFKPFSKDVWWRNLLWLLPFLLLWVISLLAFSYVSNFIATGKILNKQIFTTEGNKYGGYPIILIITFALFSLFSIPLFIMANKPDIIHLENRKLIVKKTNWVNLSLFFVGFSIILGIGLIVFFIRDGIVLDDLEKKDQAAKLEFSVETSTLVCVSMMLAGFAMLIPGISGSLVLYMFGTYKDIFWTILKHPFTNIGYVFICGACVLVGILICIFSTSWLIKKYRSQYYAFCLGMVCSSFIAILLAGKKYFATFVTQTNVIVPLFFLSIIVVLIVNACLFMYIKKNRKLDKGRTWNMN